MLNEYQVFYSVLLFLLEQLRTAKDLQVADVLGDSSTEEWIVKVTGGPTADPAMWDDWKCSLEEALKENRFKNKNSNYVLTREQALKAMTYFLEKRYWEKNHDMFLKEVIIDIENFIINDFVEQSIWLDWITSVKQGLEFKAKW